VDEIIIKKWCDIHASEKGSPRVEATESFTIAAAEGKRTAMPRLLVTCAEHGQPFRELIVVLRVHGEKVAETVANSGRDWTCPICEAPILRASAANHIIDRHKGKRPKLPLKCPDCGEKYSTGTTMTNHRRKHHGYDYVAEMVASVPNGGRRKG
jgi:hypothetical protein